MTARENPIRTRPRAPRDCAKINSSLCARSRRFGITHLSMTFSCDETSFAMLIGTSIDGCSPVVRPSQGKVCG